MFLSENMSRAVFFMVACGFTLIASIYNISVPVVLHRSLQVTILIVAVPLGQTTIFVVFFHTAQNGTFVILTFLD